MSRTSPWSDIAKPHSDYNVRKVSAPSAVPMFWGRDSAGSILFIIELDGNYTAEFRSGNVSVHGIAVDLRQETANVQRLVIALDRSVDQDVFQALCEGLISSLSEVATPAAALAVCLTHLRRWKAFWAGRRSRLLSPEEVRGLFAELQFLMALYSGTLTHRQAVTAWTGPESIQQDFIFGNSAVEVKSLWGRDRNTVRISSEDQLQTVSDYLFLMVYRLSEAEGDGGHSLNDLISLIEAQLGDAEALEEFSRKLADFGYLPLPDYDKPRFRAAGRQAYRVEGNFPRLTRSTIPSGIARLSYEIELEAIAGFQCSDSVVLRGG